MAIPTDTVPELKFAAAFLKCAEFAAGEGTLAGEAETHSQGAQGRRSAAPISDPEVSDLVRRTDRGEPVGGEENALVSPPEGDRAQGHRQEF